MVLVSCHYLSSGRKLFSLLSFVLYLPTFARLFLLFFSSDMPFHVPSNLLILQMQYIVYFIQEALLNYLTLMWLSFLFWVVWFPMSTLFWSISHVEFVTSLLWLSWAVILWLYFFFLFTCSIFSLYLEFLEEDFTVSIAFIPDILF